MLIECPIRTLSRSDTLKTISTLIVILVFAAAGYYCYLDAPILSKTEPKSESNTPVKRKVKPLERRLDIIPSAQNSINDIKIENVSSVINGETQYPALTEGATNNIQEVRDYIVKRVNEEKLANEKFNQEHLLLIAHLESGYKHYDIETLRPLADNGDIDASLAILGNKQLATEERLLQLKNALVGGGTLPYYLYAYKRSGEEVTAYLTAAMEKGSEMAKFSLELDRNANQQSGLILNSEKVKRYLDIARKEMDLVK